MATAAIFQAELTDIYRRSLVDDRFSDHDRRVLFLEAPGDMDRYLSFWIQRVDHKAVAGMDHFFIAQVKDNDLVINLRDPLQLSFEKVRLFKIKIDPLLHIRKFKDLINVMFQAIIDQLHHQSIIRNPEIMEASEAGPRIHQIVKKHPAFRVQDLIHGKIGTVTFVHRGHQIIRNARECFLPSIVVINHPCGALCVRIYDQFTAGFDCFEAVHFRFMVVKSDRDTRVIRQVGGDIIFAQFDLAILHILGMDKFDLVDQIQFFQHHGACQTVKIASCYESSRLVIHSVILHFLATISV